MRLRSYYDTRIQQNIRHCHRHCQATYHQLPRITNPPRLIFSYRAYIHSLGYQFVSTLWTPSGEHPLRNNTRKPSEQEHPSREAAFDASARARAGSADTPKPATEQDQEAALDDLRRAIASAPAEEVVANHCYGLFELAAIHLSKQPPDAKAAQLAIDAMGAVLGGVGNRLGQHAATLQDGLAQIRLAYVTITAGDDARPGAADTPASAPAEDGPAHPDHSG